MGENDNGSKRVEASLHHGLLAHQRMAPAEGADSDNRN
jgi:hypothetical protein